MAKRLNKIIQADDDIGYEASRGIGDDFGDEGEDLFAGEELTTDDVSEMTDALESESRARLESSRTRGAGAPSKGKSTKSNAGKHDELMEWTPANTLDAPPPRDGMVQRWIRFTLDNDDDPRNWTRKAREGWTPRSLDTVGNDYSPPTLQHGKHGTLIGVGDLILCEMPRALHQSRKKFFRQKWERQLAAIERRPLDEATSRGGPQIQRASKKTTTFGRRKSAAMSEED